MPRLESKPSKNGLEIDLILPYPVGATVKDRSRHMVRGCTRVGPNQAVGPNRAVGPDRLRARDRTVCLIATGVVRSPRYITSGLP